MGNSVAINLSGCKKVIEYKDGLNYFSLCDEQGLDAQRYDKADDAIKAYLKKAEVDKGSVLIYKSVCLNPPNGGWYDPSKRVRYSRAVYEVTLDQLLHLSNLHEKHAQVELFQVVDGQPQKVEGDTLVRAWFETVSPETKQEWLQKLLLREVLKSPLSFL